MPDERPSRIVELAGGVGGARLAHGLQAHLGSRLTVVVNVGDDLERHGLLVCPDQDTVLYTLAGIGNAELGWGIAGETYAAAEMLERLGEETWFRLGDRDLATHVRRTKRLRDGARLTEVAGELARSLGVQATILPVTDDAVRTEVRTDDGWLEFQEYFVHRYQAPEVRDVRFRDAESAIVTPEVVAAIGAADAIVVAPSNPIVSIAPILAVPGVRAAVENARARGIRVIAVSPIVGGRALRGPADRMLVSLGHESSAIGVARLYAGWIDAFVLDAQDAALASEVRALGIDAVVTDTIMVDDAARARLAAVVLDAVSATPAQHPFVEADRAADAVPDLSAAPDLSRPWAVVPLRGLETAKTRLGGELDAEERLELVVAMAVQTLEATRGSSRLAGTLLVTADPAAARLAERFGARTLVQRIAGLNAAIREGRAIAVREGATAIVVLPIDLAAVSATAIDSLLSSADRAPAGRPLVLVVPDRHGAGTNVLVVAPPTAIEPAFGTDSRKAHRAAAAAAGATYLEAAGPLTLDVDTADDLLAAEAGARASSAGRDQSG